MSIRLAWTQRDTTQSIMEHLRIYNDVEKGDSVHNGNSTSEKLGLNVSTDNEIDDQMSSSCSSTSDSDTTETESEDITMNQTTTESEIWSYTWDTELDNEIDDQISSSCSSTSDSDTTETESEEYSDEDAKKFLKEVNRRKLIAYKRAGSPYTNNERELRKHARILRSNTSEEISIFPHAGKPRNIQVLPRIQESPSLSVSPHEDLMQEWIDTFLKLS